MINADTCFYGSSTLSWFEEPFWKIPDAAPIGIETPIFLSWDKTCPRAPLWKQRCRILKILFFWKKNTFCFVFKVDVILPIIYKKNQNALQIDWTSRIMLCAIYLWKAKQKVMIYEEFWQMVMGSPDPHVCCSRSAVKHCNGNVQPPLGVARAAVHGAASDSLFM